MGTGGRGRVVPTLAVGEDPALLLAAAAAGADARVRAAVAAAGFADVRPGHAAVLAHLAGGPRSVGDLAARLGITAQGASKVVLELERLGYVTRADGPDRRTRAVTLTERGHAAIEATATARAALRADIDELLGPRGGSQLRRYLRLVAAETGGYGEAGGATAARLSRAKASASTRSASRASREPARRVETSSTTEPA